jgi:uncharacterized OsmC-like protein
MNAKSAKSGNLIPFHLHVRQVAGGAGTATFMGVAKDAPVGFREIRLTFDLDTEATQEQIDSLIKLTERYCVIFQTLNKPPKLGLVVNRV